MKTESCFFANPDVILAIGKIIFHVSVRASDYDSGLLACFGE